MRQDATFHSIQLLRAVAATLVVLFHAQQAFAREVSAPLFGQESYLFAFGAVGVHIFFVISGFIMVLTSRQPGRPYSASQFFRRRLLRIYPIYWLCALAYVAAHAAIGRPYDVSPDDLVGALLLWPEDAARLIGPAWTLSFEMYFYICFGLAMTLSLTRGLIVLGAAFVGAIALAEAVHRGAKCPCWRCSAGIAVRPPRGRKQAPQPWETPPTSPPLPSVRHHSRFRRRGA